VALFSPVQDALEVDAVTKGLQPWIADDRRITEEPFINGTSESCYCPRGLAEI
jgi:hypothetical protein